MKTYTLSDLKSAFEAGALSIWNDERGYGEPFTFEQWLQGKAQTTDPNSVIPTPP